MKEYHIPFTRTVTSEEIDDLMTTALVGGCNYWMEQVEVDTKPTEEATYISDVLTRGGTLKVYVIDEDVTYGLTLDEVIQALSGSSFDFDDYDSGDADAIIQTALFGEVIYG